MLGSRGAAGSRWRVRRTAGCAATVARAAGSPHAFVAAVASRSDHLRSSAGRIAQGSGAAGRWVRSVCVAGRVRRAVPLRTGGPSLHLQAGTRQAGADAWQRRCIGAHAGPTNPSARNDAWRRPSCRLSRRSCWTGRAWISAPLGCLHKAKVDPGWRVSACSGHWWIGWLACRGSRMQVSELDGERGLGTDLPSDLAKQRCWSMPRLRRGWCGLSDGTGVFLHVQVTGGLGGLRAVDHGCMEWCLSAPTFPPPHLNAS
eukprot:COSAG03_NODE_5555_length_1221_cov_0.959893_2_plen_257_part_01